MFLQDRAKEINEKLRVLAGISNIVVWAVVISVPAQEKNVVSMLRDELKYSGLIITLYDDKKSIPFYLLYDERISGIRYLGDYANWQDAAAECRGYDDSVIFDKVIQASKKVIDGEAVWERDSFLFYQEKYVYKLCAAILRCALRNDNQGVRVLDIGGSLGSTYFQNRKYLSDVKNLEYVVAEQDRYAAYGHEYLEDAVLKFISSQRDWENMERFDIILMSASLQYIPNYAGIISKIKKAEPRYIIFDRVLVGDRGRICRETVPETIYKSSYPLRIFSEEEIRDFCEPEYKLIENDISSVPETAYFVDGKAESRFYVFQNAMLE